MLQFWNIKLKTTKIRLNSLDKITEIGASNKF